MVEHPFYLFYLCTFVTVGLDIFLRIIHDVDILLRKVKKISIPTCAFRYIFPFYQYCSFIKSKVSVWFQREKPLVSVGETTSFSG